MTKLHKSRVDQKRPISTYLNFLILEDQYFGCGNDDFCVLENFFKLLKKSRCRACHTLVLLLQESPVFY